jgi:DNA-directed RNA polymerase subunit RPC12/RpoP
MSHVWTYEDGAGLTARELPRSASVIGVYFSNEIRLLSDCTTAATTLLVRSAGTSHEERWVLITREHELRVNGRAVAGGAVALADRDEIRMGAARAYFSTERAAEIEPYPHASSVVCARCRSEITHGTPAIRCPRCDVWHHQDDRRPCYTYTETCSTCSRSTDLARGFEWTPAALYADPRDA